MLAELEAAVGEHLEHVAVDRPARESAALRELVVDAGAVPGQRVALVPAPLLRPQLEVVHAAQDAMQGHVTPRAELAIATRDGQASWGQHPIAGGYLPCASPRCSPYCSRFFFAAPASAAVPHIVQPGETLWSIAAANNLTTRTVAAFNGLSENSQVVLGSHDPGAVAPSRATPRCRRRASSPPRPPPLVRPGCGRRAAAAPAPLLPPRMGGYTVRAGRHAVRPRRRRARVRQRDRRDERAQPERRAARRHRASSCRPARPPRRAPRSRRRPRRSCPQAAPEPTATRVGAADVQSVAAQHGVSPSLATAIAWQESGFNNAWSPRPTRAASCRSCRARGTTCSRTSPRAS